MKADTRFNVNSAPQADNLYANVIVLKPGQSPSGHDVLLTVENSADGKHLTLRMTPAEAAAISSKLPGAAGPVTSPILEFAEQVARMANESEIENGGTAEDHIATLNALIEKARALTGIDPGYPKLYEETPYASNV